MPQTKTWLGFASHFTCAPKCKSSVCDLVRVSSLILVLTWIDKKEETDSNKQSDLHFGFYDFKYKNKQNGLHADAYHQEGNGSNCKSRLHILCKYKRNIYNWGGTVNDFLWCKRLFGEFFVPNFTGIFKILTNQNFEFYSNTDWCILMNILPEWCDT